LIGQKDHHGSHGKLEEHVQALKPPKRLRVSQVKKAQFQLCDWVSELSSEFSEAEKVDEGDADGVQQKERTHARSICCPVRICAFDGEIFDQVYFPFHLMTVDDSVRAGVSGRVGEWASGRVCYEQSGRVESKAGRECKT